VHLCSALVFQHAYHTTRLCAARCGQRTLATALVPSDTACLASSPGNTSRTAAWMSCVSDKTAHEHDSFPVRIVSNKRMLQS